MLIDRDFKVELDCPRVWSLGVRGGMGFAVLVLSALTFRPVAVGAASLAPSAGKEAMPEQKAQEAVESGVAFTILDPDGKPAAGAAVYRTNATFIAVENASTAVLLGRSGLDGSFRLSAQEAKVNPKAPPNYRHQIVVTAPGYGPAFVDPLVDGGREVRLVKDDVPIRGRVIDVDGRPVAGATIQLFGILWHPSGSLDEWLKALQSDQDGAAVTDRLMQYWASDEIPNMFPAVVTTDRDGRYLFKGVGRERIGVLRVSGPRIENHLVFAATREMPTLRAGNTYHGASCDVVAGPGLEVIGTVRDADTGKSLAGATVQTTAPYGNPSRFVKTTTDAEGRYRLMGLSPKTMFGDEHSVIAKVSEGPAYVSLVQPVGKGHGGVPIQRDFALKRGIWVRGRISNQLTGEPVRAGLNYHVLVSNPHLKDYRSYGTVRFSMPYSSDETGVFQIAVMPGRAILGSAPIFAFDNTYRSAVGIDKLNVKKIGPIGRVVEARPDFMAWTYSSVVEINPRVGEDLVNVDIAFDPGRTVKGRLIGPDGEPVVGARYLGDAERFEQWSNPNTLPTDEFEMHVRSKGKCGLLFYHEEKQLAGVYLGEADESGQVTVKMEPCGTLTGRLVGNVGRPRAGVVLTSDRPYEEGESRFEHGSLPGGTRTDQEGKFRLSGLVPGLKYSLNAWGDGDIVGNVVKAVIVKSGEMKNVGDVSLSP